MSRILYVGQKKLIKAEWERVRRTGVEYPLYNDLNGDILDAIDALNCNELFWQNTNRYIDDLNNELLKEKQKRMEWRIS